MASGFLRQQVEGVFIYLVNQSEASPTRRELMVARMGKDENESEKKSNMRLRLREAP